ncbi:hypothetical protein CS8_022770 [Cupriavidus sp. 8B]
MTTRVDNLKRDWDIRRRACLYDWHRHRARFLGVCPRQVPTYGTQSAVQPRTQSNPSAPSA